MNKILEIVLQFLMKVITGVTPKLRQQLLEVVEKWEKRAEQTANPYDDFFVGILKSLLGD